MIIMFIPKKNPTLPAKSIANWGLSDREENVCLQPVIGGAPATVSATGGTAGSPRRGDGDDEPVSEGGEAMTLQSTPTFTSTSR
jgi:hypothetical protein